ncbi:AI-2E family transporter [soil metagenome]
MRGPISSHMPKATMQDPDEVQVDEDGAEEHDPQGPPAPEDILPDVDLDQRPYVRVGRYAWATVGIVGVLVVAGFGVSQVSLVIIPAVLALFPAALLSPVTRWLKAHKVPPALASLLTILGLLGAVAGIFFGLAVFALDDLPELQESLVEGVGELEQTIQDDPLGLGYDFPGFGSLFEDLRGSVAEGVNGGGEESEEGALAGGAVGAATAVVEAITGLLLLFVALFFYLKDEGRLSDGVIATMPRRWQHHARELAGQFWHTTGAYFRGQIVVATVDAVLIGLGLVLLGIPLAIPLAVLVLFASLFPIIGALLSGAVAVLVALADAGPFRALMVLILIVVVQQIEGNVLEPIILSQAIALHPLVIVLSLTTGSILLGILGAFLSVPVAASIARAVDYLREQSRASGDPPRAEAPSAA